MADMPPLATAPDGADADAWAAACAAVRAYCGWHIAPSITSSVTVDGSGGAAQLLPTLHLTKLTSITNDGRAVSDPEWSAAGVVRGSWTCKMRGVTAEMTHGYESCPPEVLAVVTEAATRGVSGSFVAQVGQVRMGGTDGLSGAVPFIIEARSAILDRYRIPLQP